MTDQATAADGLAAGDDLAAPLGRDVATMSGDQARGEIQAIKDRVGALGMEHPLMKALHPLHQRYVEHWGALADRDRAAPAAGAAAVDPLTREPVPALQVPETVDGYEVKGLNFAEDVPAETVRAELDEVRQGARDLGLTRAEFASCLACLQHLQGRFEPTDEVQIASRMAQRDAELQNAWGDDFEARLGVVREAVEKLPGPVCELLAFSGLLDEARVVKTIYAAVARRGGAT